MNYETIIKLSEQPSSGDSFRLVIDIPDVYTQDENITFVTTITDADTQVLIGSDAADTQNNLKLYMEYFKDTMQPTLTSATVTNGVSDYDVVFSYLKIYMIYEILLDPNPSEGQRVAFDIEKNASVLMNIDKTFLGAADIGGSLLETKLGASAYQSCVRLINSLTGFNDSEPSITYIEPYLGGDTNVLVQVIGNGDDVWTINEIFNDAAELLVYPMFDDVITNYVFIEDNEINIMKTLSPYRIETPFTNPITSVVCESYTLQIYIWSGNLSAVPALPEYAKTKINVTNSNGTDLVNISRIVNDFIDFSCIQNTSTSLQDGNNQYWVKTKVLYNDQPTVEQNSKNFLALKGYGYFMDGDKPQPPANRVLLTGDEFKINRYGTFVLPILLDPFTDYGDIIVKSYPANEIDYTFATGATDESNEIVKYVWIDNSEATTDSYIEVEFNGVTTTLLITDECRYTPLDIAFQNKEGAIQVLTFFKAKKDSITLTNETFESNRGLGYHQYVKYNVQSKSKFSVNSGFIVEDRNESIKQLLLSERVWLLYGGTETPLNVVSSSLEYKTRQNDRLINYAIEFEYAFNDINNI